MRRVFAPAALVVALVSTTIVFAQKGDATSAVTKAERAWESGMRAKDSAAVEKVLAANWLGVNPDASSSTRTQFLAAVKNGDYATVKLDEINVRMAGPTAIAYGKATDKDGKYAYTDVFVEEGGTWRAVYSQIALVPPPSKK